MDNNEELVEQQETTVETSMEEGQETVTEISEVEALQATLSETEDRLLRLQAELANIQKRNAKERQDAAKYRSQSLAQELLPVMDSLEHALAIEVEDEKAVHLQCGRYHHCFGDRIIDVAGILSAVHPRWHRCDAFNLSGGVGTVHFYCVLAE